MAPSCHTESYLGQGVSTWASSSVPASDWTRGAWIVVDGQSQRQETRSNTHTHRHSVCFWVLKVCGRCGTISVCVLCGWSVFKWLYMN